MAPRENLRRSGSTLSEAAGVLFTLQLHTHTQQQSFSVPPAEGKQEKNEAAVR